MKRLLSILLCCLFALAACSRQSPTAEESIPEAAVIESLSPPEPEPTDPYKDLWRRIDGSTATIPLSEQLFTHLGSTPTEGAILHNRTHQAYESLISGDSDIIFVTYPSEEELRLMSQSGEDFEVIPVVKDAFVLVINAKNPVSSLLRK